MSQTNSKRISDWSKENHVSAEVVFRLLRDRGVDVKSLVSAVDIAVLETIRPAALAEQERLDKKQHARKAPPSSGSRPSSESRDQKGETKTESSQSSSGGRQLKVTLRRGASEGKPQGSAPAQVPSVSIHKSDAPAPEKVGAVAVLAAKEESASLSEHASPRLAPVESGKEPEVAAPVSASVPMPQGEAESAEKAPRVAADPPKPVAPPVQAAPARTAPLKATVEKPSAEMLARIQKYQQQAQQRAASGGRPGGQGRMGQSPGNARQSQGYTGSFGRSSAGPSGSNRGVSGAAGGSAQRPAPQRGVSGSPGAGRFGGAMQDAMIGAGFEQSAGRSSASRDGGKNKKGKSGKPIPKEQNKEQLEAIRQNVSRVMASLSKNPVKKVYRKEVSERGPDESRKVLKTSDFITVGELAGLMEQMPAKVIAKCMEMGMMVTINHRLDFETIQVLADEFGFDAELMEEYEEENLGITQESKENLKPRPPVVTVMGHVDHGKTSLLDYIRKANVVAGESGGITQHIGAYEVVTPHGNVTFLDTPGHEAFSAMRARGSQLTDVIVLVVAADSMVMPQTVECIELAKNAKVPIVVAITKIDLPTANPDKIRAQLAERGVEVEQWGGQTSCVEVSSKTGQGIDRLLEILALETEVLELRANPEAPARGTVVESRLDPGKGAVATVLIQNGTLRIGDVFVCGIYSGRVRAMFDHTGKPRKEAGPSVPCQILGFDGTPQAGDDLIVFEDEKQARAIASSRRMAARERELRFRKHMSLEQVYDRVKTGEFSELNLIVKADVDGSAEAIAAALEKLSNREVKINIIRKGVGAVNDSDILLASTADAVIIAFHLMPSLAIREMAEREGVQIKTYRIIYEIIEEIQGVVEGMLKPTLKEELVGEAEVREVFRIPKVGIVAGCMVRHGLVDKESHVRVYRDGVEKGVTHVQSLKRHKDDVSSVKEGMECGIGLRGYDDIQVGDALIFFKEVQVARTLADVASEAADVAKAVSKGAKKRE